MKVKTFTLLLLALFVSSIAFAQKPAMLPNVKQATAQKVEKPQVQAKTMDAQGLQKFMSAEKFAKSLAPQKAPKMRAEAVSFSSIDDVLGTYLMTYENYFDNGLDEGEVVLHSTTVTIAQEKNEDGEVIEGSVIISGFWGSYTEDLKGTVDLEAGTITIPTGQLIYQYPGDTDAILIDASDEDAEAIVLTLTEDGLVFDGYWGAQLVGKDTFYVIGYNTTLAKPTAAGTMSIKSTLYGGTIKFDVLLVQSADAKTVTIGNFADLDVAIKFDVSERTFISSNYWNPVVLNTYYNDWVYMQVYSGGWYPLIGNGTTTSISFYNGYFYMFNVGGGWSFSNAEITLIEGSIRYLTIEDIDVVAGADDNNLTSFLKEQERIYGILGDITLNLTNGVEYYIDEPIKPAKNLTINGNGATIDCKYNSNPFIQLSETPLVEEISSYYRVSNVTLKDVTLKNVNNSLIWDGNTKYCVENLTIDNSVIGLKLEGAQNDAVISFQAGGVKDLNIMKSTVYGTGEVAKYFVRYNNSARLDRYGYDKETESQTMNYQQNTFYNVLAEDGQWGNYSGYSGQDYTKFDVQKNIWFNCGKDIVRRLAGGRFGAGASKTFFQNSYFNRDKDTSESESSYDDSGTILTTWPGFKDPEMANFALTNLGSDQNKYQTGDPRWIMNYDPGYVDGIQNVESTTKNEGAWYSISGQRVAQPTKGVFIHNGRKVVMK